MRDISLMPQRYVLHTGLQVASQHPRQTANGLSGDRIALVGHRRRTLLAHLEALLYLAHLGALQVTQLDGNHFHRGANRCARPQKLGVAIARDHLSGRHGSEAKLGSNERLDRRIDIAIRANGTAELAHSYCTTGSPKSLAIAIDLQRPERNLHAKRCGLGMHTVGAADHHRVAMRDCELLHNLEQCRC